MERILSIRLFDFFTCAERFLWPGFCGKGQPGALRDQAAFSPVNKSGLLSSQNKAARAFSLSGGCMTYIF